MHFKILLRLIHMPDQPSSLRWCQAVKGNLTPAWIKTRRAVAETIGREGGKSSYKNAWSSAICHQKTSPCNPYLLPWPCCYQNPLLSSFLRIPLALSMQERCVGIDPAATDNAVLRETHQLLMAMQIVETRELFTVISLWFAKCPCLMWSLTWYIIPLQFKQ